MNNKPDYSPKDCLNSRQQTLADKHHSRLVKMTQEALQPQENIWRSLWMKPALATAFSLLLVTSIVILNSPEKQTGSVTPDVNLPEWVTDTEVPLTLIENLEFYDWLAQQPENKQAKLQKSLTLALNEFHHYRSGKRFATSDFTQRVSGTAYYLGKIQ